MIDHKGRDILMSFTFSWTVMTWIVVFGSTIVMLLWIVVFSFFPSKDFVDEVVVLYGNITFWSTVLLSATVALGKAKVNFATKVLPLMRPLQLRGSS